MEIASSRQDHSTYHTKRVLEDRSMMSCRVFSELEPSITLKRHTPTPLKMLTLNFPNLDERVSHLTLGPLIDSCRAWRLLWSRYLSVERLDPAIKGTNNLPYGAKEMKSWGNANSRTSIINRGTWTREIRPIISEAPQFLRDLERSRATDDRRTQDF